MVLTYGKEEGASRLGGINVEKEEETYGIGGIKIKDDAPVGGVERNERYRIGCIEVEYSPDEFYELVNERDKYLVVEPEKILAEDDHWFPL